MPRLLPFVLSSLIMAASTGAALAHPHTDDPTKAASKNAEKAPTDFDRYFDKHAKSLKDALSTLETDSTVIVKRFDRNAESDAPKARSQKRIEIIENPDALRSTARDIENMLADSGVLSGLADMIIGLAEDIEITDTGDGMSLAFNGKKIGSIESNGEDNLNIDGFGKSTTIEKEVFMENGKRKTRIIIETDADAEFDIVEKKRDKKGEF